MPKILTIRTCTFCRTTYELMVDAEVEAELSKPRSARRLMQDIMPTVPPLEREQIVNGTHPKCSLTL